MEVVSCVRAPPSKLLHSGCCCCCCCRCRLQLLVLLLLLTTLFRCWSRSLANGILLDVEHPHEDQMTHQKNEPWGLVHGTRSRDSFTKLRTFQSVPVCWTFGWVPAFDPDFPMPLVEGSQACECALAARSGARVVVLTDVARQRLGRKMGHHGDRCGCKLRIPLLEKNAAANEFDGQVGSIRVQGEACLRSDSDICSCCRCWSKSSIGPKKSRGGNVLFDFVSGPLWVVWCPVSPDVASNGKDAGRAVARLRSSSLS